MQLFLDRSLAILTIRNLKLLIILTSAPLMLIGTCTPLCFLKSKTCSSILLTPGLKLLSYSISLGSLSPSSTPSCHVSDLAHHRNIICKPEFGYTFLAPGIWKESHCQCDTRIMEQSYLPVCCFSIFSCLYSLPSPTHFEVQK